MGLTSHPGRCINYGMFKQSKALIALVAVLAVVATAGALAIASSGSSSFPEPDPPPSPGAAITEKSESVMDEICADPSNCTLINVTSLNAGVGVEPSSEETRFQSEDGMTYGVGEIATTGIPADKCPEATAVYAADGLRVDGYIGGGCPVDAALEVVEAHTKDAR